MACWGLAPHLEWGLAYPRMNEKCGNLSFEMGGQVVLAEDGWSSYKYVVSGQNGISSPEIRRREAEIAIDTRHPALCQICNGLAHRRACNLKARVDRRCCYSMERVWCFAHRVRSRKANRFMRLFDFADFNSHHSSLVLTLDHSKWSQHQALSATDSALWQTCWQGDWKDCGKSLPKTSTFPFSQVFITWPVCFSH